MYSVHDWAEVHRLHHREQLPKAVIARRLGMSRQTVSTLLALDRPPRYERSPAGSILDPFKDRVAELLDDDARAPATVILQRLRREGYAGGITVLKDHLVRLRPTFIAAKARQRTSYLPGEIVQRDWWHTGAQIPVGGGATREAFGWVTTLPHSAAHAVVFSFTRTMTDLLPAR